ncbi:hypothetical protein NTE_02011 [Candidatus Nitrososphaera evergladensis SR1]|jgi:hypothetical protein|uniref:Uncharacterized protein n=1 Tax=Candidatus Nitrososphaera evergladensis SR1 TaxID=1459636 RepID=A0A075MSD2_9ARCH|nr:hypothetical protein NTE_02011 [Candidatus Nitrososphaera evergladensis SR1]
MNIAASDVHQPPSSNENNRAEAITPLVKRVPETPAYEAELKSSMLLYLEGGGKLDL